VGKTTGHVRFSRHSSVFNSIETDHEIHSDYELVPTITLSKIIKDIPSSIFVKMDCEGGEYDIVLNSEDSVFDKIEDCRLEYHRGPHHKLFDRFIKLGFVRRQFMDESKRTGYLWLVRPIKGSDSKTL